MNYLYCSYSKETNELIAVSTSLFYCICRTIQFAHYYDDNSSISGIYLETYTTNPGEIKITKKIL